MTHQDWQCRCEDIECLGKTTPPGDLIYESAQALIRATDGRAIISSGVRCEDYNERVGGSANSRHLPRHADAVDLVAEGILRRDLWIVAMRVLPLSIMCVGIYPWGMHLDTRGEHHLWVYRPLVEGEGRHAAIF